MPREYSRFVEYLERSPAGSTENLACLALDRHNDKVGFLLSYECKLNAKINEEKSQIRITCFLLSRYHYLDRRKHLMRLELDFLNTFYALTLNMAPLSRGTAKGILTQNLALDKRNERL